MSKTRITYIVAILFATIVACGGGGGGGSSTSSGVTVSLSLTQPDGTVVTGGRSGARAAGLPSDITSISLDSLDENWNHAGTDELDLSTLKATLDIAADAPRTYYVYATQADGSAAYAGTATATANGSDLALSVAVEYITAAPVVTVLDSTSRSIQEKTIVTWPGASVLLSVVVATQNGESLEGMTYNSSDGSREEVSFVYKEPQQTLWGPKPDGISYKYYARSTITAPQIPGIYSYWMHVITEWLVVDKDTLDYTGRNIKAINSTEFLVEVQDTQAAPTPTPGGGSCTIFDSGVTFSVSPDSCPAMGKFDVAPLVYAAHGEDDVSLSSGTCFDTGSGGCQVCVNCP